MTENFDKLVNHILNEAKCTHPTMRQVSDRKGFRWMACRENPYADGVKKVRWGRKDKSFNFDRCLKTQRKGTEAYETCRDFWIQHLRRTKREK